MVVIVGFEEEMHTDGEISLHFTHRSSWGQQWGIGGAGVGPQ